MRNWRLCCIDCFLVLSIGIHYIQYFVVSLCINIFFNNEGVDGLALLHVFVNIYKIVSIVKL